MTEESRIASAQPSYDSLEIVDIKPFPLLPARNEITQYIGNWGRWQTQIFLLLSWIGIEAAAHLVAQLFFVPEAKHWCSPPENLTVATNVWKNFSIPPDKQISGEFSSCSMYDQDYSKVTPVPIPYEEDDRDLPTVPCQYGWEYNTMQLNSTPQNEWDLVCDREYLAKAISSSYNVGLLFGAILYGQLSDISGRKVAIVVGMISSAMAAIMVAFAPSLRTFLILRFVVAMGDIGAESARFVMLMEMVDSKSRTALSMIVHVPVIVGSLITCGLGYAFVDWRNLQLAISIPMIAYLPFLLFLPESIRWLIAEGEHQEAYDILHKAATVNKKIMPPFPHYFARVTFSEEDLIRKHTIVDLFQYPNLRAWTLILSIIWLIHGLLFFGLPLNINKIGDNVYVNVFIASAVEVPALILSTIIVMMTNRRSPTFVLMILSGVCCLIGSLFPMGDFAYDWPIIGSAVLGKFCITSSFHILYLLTSEIFPTVARNVGVGLSLAMSRIGAIITPYVLLLSHFHPSIPMVVYGVAGVAGSLVMLKLPDTKDVDMPETIKDAEVTKKHKRSFSCKF